MRRNNPYDKEVMFEDLCDGFLHNVFAYNSSDREEDSRKQLLNP